MKIQNRDYIINSDGTISIKKINGNMSTITGKILGTNIKIEKVENVGSNYRVTANGITKDILSSDADKLISFVDTGNPKTIKRQNAGFLEPSVSLFLIKETTPSGQTTTYQISEARPLIEKIAIGGLSIMVIYLLYKKIKNN